MMRALNLLFRKIKDKLSHHAQIRDDKKYDVSKFILRVNIIKSSISVLRSRKRARFVGKKKRQQGDWNTMAMRLAESRDL